jgi:hypothetical protein
MPAVNDDVARDLYTKRVRVIAGLASRLIAEVRLAKAHVGAVPSATLDADPTSEIVGCRGTVADLLTASGLCDTIVGLADANGGALSKWVSRVSAQ